MPGYDLELRVDASGIGCGAVLYQYQPGTDGKLVPKPLGFVSRVFTQAEHTRSCALQYEVLGFLFVLSQFHHFLLLNHLTVKVDSDALPYALQNKEVMPQLARLT